MSEAAVKAVDERISALKGHLVRSAGRLANHIGHCNCTQAEPCAECEADEKCIKDIEVSLGE